MLPQAVKKLRQGLDKAPPAWYNTITNKKGIDKHDKLLYHCF